MIRTTTYDDTLYQLVPKEPTQEQRTVMEDAFYESGDTVKAYKAGLSAAPTPPAQPAETKPLTEEQIAILWFCDEYGAGHDYAPGYARIFARAIEAAHGIKGES